MITNSSTASLKDVTLEWLTSVLNQEGNSSTYDVKNLKRRPCNNVSTSSVLYRLELNGTKGEEEFQTSLIFKLPRSNEECKEFSKIENFYKREVIFYQVFAPQMITLVPKCIDLAWNEENHDFHLLLEDCQLSGKQNPILIGPTLKELYQSIEWLAVVHSQWWNHTELNKWSGLLSSWQNVKPINLAHFSLINEWFGKREKDLLLYVLDQWDSILSTQVNASKTLCHGDFHPMNIFYPVNSEFKNPKIIDWQFCHIGLGVSDLADYLSLFIHPQLRKRYEDILVRFYWEKLIEHGVTNYTFKQCVKDYESEVIKNIAMPLFQLQIPNLPLSVIVQCFRNVILAADGLIEGVKKN